MREIGIIIPTFEEPRVLKAVQSIIDCDRNTEAQIVVIDGSPQPTDKLKQILREDDILISEPDNGIFDALNKGLQLLNCRFIGWMGADDIWLINISEVVSDLRENNVDILAYTTLFHNPSKRIVRVFPSISNQFIRRYGFHLPHFSTFVRREAINSMRFNTDYSPVSDIMFFIELENSIKANRIKTKSRASTSMMIGGTSNANIGSIIRNNLKLYNIIGRKYNYIYAFIFIFNKLIFKILQKFLASLTSRTYLEKY